MSTPSTIERSERLTLADMVVVDADVHVNDTPGRWRPTAICRGGCRSRRCTGHRIPISRCRVCPRICGSIHRSRGAMPTARSIPRRRCAPS